ncbi:hypothetical protein L210DRAFT_3549617 [Boletus edulis BED1]|uniref:Uncharacterized protein n=1 Tax=Boletus edulis BED1 TaxID=1328754 RepID=A0AAD4BQ88_BOLED|nr:hypothetical protein L210DRAFT_3549617 [Boletus edulis BED1]
MIHSSSEATSNSPTPISPFSTYSRLSEATSDVHIRGYLSPRAYFYPITEAPDLGAFTKVFRELQQF